MSTKDYSNPVAKLLTYGDCTKMNLDQWPDYVGDVGLTTADASELIRMATDEDLWELEDNRVEIWAPIHAWRSLGQLQAEAAIAPLVQLFHRADEWIVLELPTVYTMIGPAAIPTLADYLANSDHDPMAREVAVGCLREIAGTYLDHRQTAIAPLIEQLKAFDENELELNSSLIAELASLQALEAAPVIEEAFAAERVDEVLCGNWPSVQVELGLKREDEFSPEELKPQMPEQLVEIRQMLEAIDAIHAGEKHAAEAKSQGFGPAASKSSPSSKSKKKKKKKK